MSAQDLSRDTNSNSQTHCASAFSLSSSLWPQGPLRCGPSMRSELSQPYAVSVFSVTVSAAFRITSSTKLGWDSIGTWLLPVSNLRSHTLCDETLLVGLDGTVTSSNDVPAWFQSPGCIFYLLIE